mmetsp:Transcript_18771/g.26027  ORF Transcript_18771/g.26027 Transcript_18771/m.26027 type:complete len:344 (-) Transcript_18771:523-1554(-)
MKCMKLSALLGLFAVCLLSGPVSTDAKKFAPTSFIAKKNAVKNADILSQKKDGFQSSAVVESRGGELITTARTRLSYYAELAWTAGIAIFMVLWLRSKSLYDSNPGSYTDEFPHFNEMVLKDGFCINPTPSGPSGLGTLKLCGIADALLIAGSYLFFKDKLDLGSNKLIFYGSAGYTLLHGAIHFFEVDQTGIIWDPNNSLATNLLGVGLLAVITAFTPIGINSAFESAGKKGGLAAGIATWIAFVLFYALGIKEKVYALTFINVTIFLSIFGARTFLLNKDDESRLDFYMGPSVLASVIAITANIVVMCFEPLACKDWFASVGGHIWFDVTLWFMMMSVMKQ